MFPALVTTGCHCRGGWVRKAEGNWTGRKWVYQGYWDGALLTLAWPSGRRRRRKGRPLAGVPGVQLGWRWSPALTLGPEEVGGLNCAGIKQSDNEAGKRLQTGALSLGSIFLTRKKLVGLNVDHKLPTTPCWTQPFPRFEISELGNFLINFIN